MPYDASLVTGLGVATAVAGAPSLWRPLGTLLAFGSYSLTQSSKEHAALIRNRKNQKKLLAALKLIEIIDQHGLLKLLDDDYWTMPAFEELERWQQEADHGIFHARQSAGRMSPLNPEWIVSESDIKKLYINTREDGFARPETEPLYELCQVLLSGNPWFMGEQSRITKFTFVLMIDRLIRKIETERDFTLYEAGVLSDRIGDCLDKTLQIFPDAQGEEFQLIREGSANHLRHNGDTSWLALLRNFKTLKQHSNAISLLEDTAGTFRESYYKMELPEILDNIQKNVLRKTDALLICLCRRYGAWTSPPLTKPDDIKFPHGNRKRMFRIFCTHLREKISREKLLELLLAECGNSTENRIFAGSLAAIYSLKNQMEHVKNILLLCGMASTLQETDILPFFHVPLQKFSNEMPVLFETVVKSFQSRYTHVIIRNVEDEKAKSLVKSILGYCDEIIKITHLAQIQSQNESRLLSRRKIECLAAQIRIYPDIDQRDLAAMEEILSVLLSLSERETLSAPVADVMLPEQIDPPSPLMTAEEPSAPDIEYEEEEAEEEKEEEPDEIIAMFDNLTESVSVRINPELLDQESRIRFECAHESAHRGCWFEEELSENRDDEPTVPPVKNEPFYYPGSGMRFSVNMAYRRERIPPPAEQKNPLIETCIDDFKYIAMQFGNYLYLTSKYKKALAKTVSELTRTDENISPETIIFCRERISELESDFEGEFQKTAIWLQNRNHLSISFPGFFNRTRDKVTRIEEICTRYPRPERFLPFWNGNSEMDAKNRLTTDFICSIVDGSDIGREAKKHFFRKLLVCPDPEDRLERFRKALFQKRSVRYLADGYWFAGYSLLRLDPAFQVPLSLIDPSFENITTHLSGEQKSILSVLFSPEENLNKREEWYNSNYKNETGSRFERLEQSDQACVERALNR